MAKTLEAKSIAGINNVAPVVDKNGKLEKLVISCDINYGDVGVSETVDILPHLDAKKVQEVYDAIANALAKIYLA